MRGATTRLRRRSADRGGADRFVLALERLEPRLALAAAAVAADEADAVDMPPALLGGATSAVLQEATSSFPPYVAGGHHDPYIPHFAHESMVAGRRILTSRGDGFWEQQFAQARAGDVIVVQNRVVLRGTADVHSIVVAAGGQLVFDPAAHSRLRVVNLQVLKQGLLQAGTAARPIDRSVHIVFKDQPLDLRRDPQQYGNGLLVLGTVHLHGREMQRPFVPLAAETAAGAKSLLLEKPVDWQVGDRISLPDSRQGDFGAGLSDRQDEVRRIAAISADGRRITLSEPLRFNHRGAHSPSTGSALLPYVANLSRNVVIRSENPSGTRGHVQAFDRADVQIRFAALQDLGRTRNGPLDSTVRDQAGNPMHVGTNQIGRYAMHLHHVVGPRQSSNGYQFAVEGNAFVTSTKWAIALHDSHYGLVNSNVIYGATGAGIVTEDGSESYNRIEGNFVAVVDGDRDRGKFRAGTEGDGIWLAGPNNSVVGNVVASVVGAGYRVYGGENSDPVMVSIPLEPGEPAHHHGVVVNLAELPLARFEGNEAYSATMGMETWYIGHKDYYDPVNVPMAESLVKDFTAWHTHRYAFFGDQQNHLTIDGLLAVGDPAQLEEYDYPEGLSLRSSKDVVVRNSRIENFKIGLTAPQKVERLKRSGPLGLRAVAPTRVESSYFQNCLDVLVTPFDFDAAAELNPGGLILDGTTLAGTTTVNMAFDASPEAGLNIVQPFRVLLQNHNGVAGANYELFWAEQRASFLVPATDRAAGLTAAPVPGLSNAQLWAAYGVAVFGQVMPAAARRRADLRIDGYVLPVPASSSAPLSMVGSVGYSLNSAPRIVAGQVDLAGSNKIDFAGGRLRVSIGQGADASNRLAIGGEFKLVDRAVMLGSQRVGTVVSDGVGQANLDVAFSAIASAAIAEQLLRSITFRTVAGTTTTPRGIEFTLLDAAGAVQDRRTRLVRVD